MTQTNDFSLSSYLTSIQSLFETIKLKSSKLIQIQSECIQDQEDYEERLVHFTDFLTQQAHYLREILSVKSQDPGFDVRESLTVLIQANLFQKHLFLHQLTHKRLFIDLPVQYMKTTSS